MKLGYYGVGETALKLFIDFMSDRSQVVIGNGGTIQSQPLKTTIGVAQGSSLSNIMFSLLLNDLPYAVQDGHVLMYADDVAAIVTAQTVDQLEHKLNNVAIDLNRWFQINGLILNTTKTHFVNLAGRTYRPLHVKVHNVHMDQVKTTTFLGFQLDSGLTWEAHINKLCDKVGRACFALWRVSGILSYDVVRSCYFASVHSLLQYGVEIWGRAADWERVFRMQKRAVRAIARVPSDTSALQLFREFGILTMPSLVWLQAALYAWDYIDEYPRRGDAHKYETRGASQLRSVSRRLAKSSKLVHVMAPEVYNRLPDGVRSADSRNIYKTKLKKWLVEQAFYKYSDGC